MHGLRPVAREPPINAGSHPTPPIRAGGLIVWDNMGYHGIYWASMEPLWATTPSRLPHRNSSLTTAALKEWLSKDSWRGLDPAGADLTQPARTWPCGPVRPNGRPAARVYGRGRRGCVVATLRGVLGGWIGTRLHDGAVPTPVGLRSDRAAAAHIECIRTVRRLSNSRPGTQTYTNLSNHFLAAALVADDPFCTMATYFKFLRAAVLYCVMPAGSSDCRCSQYGYARI
jgi:hypothetical protein